MADKKPIGGSLSESDIEFFRRELKSREPSQLTLITGTGDEAQKVLRDMIDAGASIQDGKLSNKHDSNIDGNKMKIEQTLRIEESIAQGSAMPGMTLRARSGQMKRQTDWKKLVDLTIADDMSEIDCVKELNAAVNISEIKKRINDTFQEVDFSVKEFRTEDYPKSSQAYLKESAFYCRKAREYRAKKQAAATEADSYIELGIGTDASIMEQFEQVSEKFRKVEENYSAVFYYCIQEAVYWKLKAEIYNNSEQDKKRIQDRTKSSSCKIHSENDVTKYVYIPTDKKNIEEAKIDLELIKVGLGARSGVDNVMLVVKEFEECKKQSTLDMVEKLTFYGGEFKDRGMLMVTEDSRLIDDDQPDDFSETEAKYFKNEATSDAYPDIFKISANEGKVFSFEKKRIGGPEIRTETGEDCEQKSDEDRSDENFKKIYESTKIVNRTTEGRKHKSKLAETGMRLYEDINTASKGMDFLTDRKLIDEVVTNKVLETIEVVSKLRIDDFVEFLKTLEVLHAFAVELEKRKLEQTEKDKKREEEREKERQEEKIERENKLREDNKSESGKIGKIQQNGNKMLSEIKESLDSFKDKNDPEYFKLKKKYEKLKAKDEVPFYDEDPEVMRENIRNVLVLDEIWNMGIRDLYRETNDVVRKIDSTINDGNKHDLPIDTVIGVVGGAASGALIGSVAGPAGALVGAALGATVGFIGSLKWW